MFDKKDKIITNYHERGRSSSFVIDLRSSNKPVINKNFKNIESRSIKIKNRLGKIENHILEKAQTTLSSKKIKNSLRLPVLKLPSFNINSFFCLFSKKRSLWDFVSRREALIFKKAARLNFRFIKNLNILEKRALAAENKIIWYRSIFSFIIVLILLIIPLKLLSYFEFFNLGKLEEKILNHSQLAFNNLLAASDAASELNFKIADSEFQNASNNFLIAQEELNKINDSILSLAAISNDPKLKLAAESKKFLRAGAIASSLGRNLILATDSLFNEDKESFSAALDQFTFYGELAVSDAKSLKEELAKININNLPVQYQERFSSISKQANLLNNNLEVFVKAGTKLKSLLGASEDKRYLLVFQNNSELRASGGFLGSYALVDIRDGKIRNLEVPGGGSYDTEGGMSVRVVAPQPLWLVNPLWHFWDANWWADWPSTAKNLMWFYEKSGGPTVDGVISVTPTVVERLLKITGPIDLSQEYGLIIDADNFWETVQKIVEQKNLAKTNPEALVNIPATSTILESSLPLKQDLAVNINNKPKKIIGDLMAKILEVLPKKLTKENFLEITNLFESSLAEKQILFYFSDPALQSELVDLNLAGEIKDANRDYLLVVNTNIAGQKSDRKMTETIEHSSEVNLDGTIINTLKIIRTHTGVKNEVLTGVRNVNWLRIYVPQGSELLSAEGFKAPDEKYFNEKPEPDWERNKILENEELALIDKQSGTKIYNENNKTVFANWIMVDPGESVTLLIKYRLPFNFFDQSLKSNWLDKINLILNPEQKRSTAYSLLVQKQPGAKASDFKSRLLLPQEWSVNWVYPENLFIKNGWLISDKLNADKYWSILIKK